MRNRIAKNDRKFFSLLNAYSKNGSKELFCIIICVTYKCAITLVRWYLNEMVMKSSRELHNCCCYFCLHRKCWWSNKNSCADQKITLTILSMVLIRLETNQCVHAFIIKYEFTGVRRQWKISINYKNGWQAASFT